MKLPSSLYLGHRVLEVTIKPFEEPATTNPSETFNPLFNSFLCLTHFFFLSNDAAIFGVATNTSWIQFWILSFLWSSVSFLDMIGELRGETKKILWNYFATLQKSYQIRQKKRRKEDFAEKFFKLKLKKKGKSRERK